MSGAVKGDSNYVSLIGQKWPAFTCLTGTSKNSCAGVFYVYFSSGVGRTGCFIALDLLVDEGEEDHSVDVCKCVSRLREQRVNMVQYEVRTVPA